MRSRRLSNHDDEEELDDEVDDRQRLDARDPLDSSRDSSVWNVELQLGLAAGTRRSGATARPPADLGRLGRRRAGDDDVTDGGDDVTSTNNVDVTDDPMTSRSAVGETNRRHRNRRRLPCIARG